jgi:hypothetical protein
MDYETFQNNEVIFDEINNLRTFRKGLINKVIEKVKNCRNNKYIFLRVRSIFR